jgi:tellurite resistance protein
MLYQLQKLSEEERFAVQQAPIWVTLLIACADDDIEESEIDRAKEIVHIKSFATQNDVKNLYKDVDSQMDESIDKALKALPANGEERIALLEKQISQLNDILPKLDHAYAVQLHKSLTSLAVSVAQADGGFFGINRISREEAKYIHLPMLVKP